MELPNWQIADVADGIHLDASSAEARERVVSHFLGRGGPSRRKEPLRQILRTVGRSGCRTILVEKAYVDVDYRSEYSLFWSKRFGIKPSVVSRLHFFSAEVSKDTVHALPTDAGYLGYSVLRPTFLGPVGRTVVAPPPTMDGVVLTSVTETPTVFGNEFEVTGVPSTSKTASS